ncbi:UDP-glucose:undecaprenyl-phosphate glucose-1-phosphate transferase [Pediococcus pentosaceus]|uniref:Lipopolysaccharide synthesis sugar transferase n=2 Tax=Pediococcus pentosaceus TaxID=1255 RepID=Q03GL6_PEDPA|nr:Lipopolysaccharide synthesis sugar transferase [Pediococcus pentosaceus ATCC 25745]QHM64807.1 UDP-glucose:undecaprenyl-phosphate glucose-1-phosphate transferase [Pediococcus pentosaceus]QHM66526.1 UDP-glucose:undecaprenyl-phosphate glucose-1-phosphate transferase [Pediococcus pentosaceus]QHM69320.1 UDP-glucose:undecaprenyl-phosphate glucose-1-phosphate transferase [Pediococcus pentosaceus]
MVENKKVLIDEQAQNQRYVYRFFKRMLDIVASVIGLIVLSPVFLIVSLAIKAEDRGPIFYSQVRLGKGQRPFKMWKFRSMIVDADKKLEKLLEQNEVEGAMFKMKEDPRITKVGRFTRKHSLDELPQLWNVLKGEMSLVGPRPPLEREVADYSEYDKQRLIVKPGCTGFWQVTARNDVDFEGMVNLDLEYIERSGVLFDIGILFRTVAIVFKPNGAY